MTDEEKGPVDEPRPSAPTEGERQRTVDVLCEAFADDRLSVEEFERRIEVAHAARAEGDLADLLADLPSVHRQPIRRPDDGDDDRPGAAPGPRGGVDASPDRGTGVARHLDDRDFALPPMARPDEVGAHSLVLGFMGGGGRKGHWIPTRQMFVVGVMGGAEIDFRDAVFPPGVTEVRVLAVMGGAELIIPPGVRVECSGMGIMGGVDETYTVPPTSNPDAPVLKITSLAFMGGVNVTVRYPGETGRDARKRLKSEKRGMRRLGRGD